MRCVGQRVGALGVRGPDASRRFDEVDSLATELSDHYRLGVPPTGRQQARDTASYWGTDCCDYDSKGNQSEQNTESALGNRVSADNRHEHLRRKCYDREHGQYDDTVRLNVSCPLLANCHCWISYLSDSKKKQQANDYEDNRGRDADLRKPAPRQNNLSDCNQNESDSCELRRIASACTTGQPYGGQNRADCKNQPSDRAHLATVVADSTAHLRPMVAPDKELPPAVKKIEQERCLPDGWALFLERRDHRGM